MFNPFASKEKTVYNNTDIKEVDRSTHPESVNNVDNCSMKEKNSRIRNAWSVFDRKQWKKLGVITSSSRLIFLLAMNKDHIQNV